MIIAVDFDGTVVTHEYPNVGEDIEDAVRVLKRIVDGGHKLILYTMRSGKELADATQWYSDKQIPLYGINCNPTQHNWTSSPKIYAHLYIDDAALGCPKKMNDKGNVIVDWNVIESWLEAAELLNE